MVTLDVHNLAAYQNAFRIPAEHLEARGLFVAWFAQRLQDETVVVVSPDAGGVKRADAFRESLSRALGRPVGSAFMEKRSSEGVVSGEAVVGEVGGRTAIIIDDLISSGTTLARAAAACKALGASRGFAAASHGMFTRAVPEVLADPALEKVLVADSIPPFRLPPEMLGRQVEVLDSTPLFAEAIRRLHSGGSLVELKAFALLKAHGKNTKMPSPAKLTADISKAESKFTGSFSKTEARGGCPTSGDSDGIEAKVMNSSRV